ncbi:MAG: flagellar basal-body rod protein FlgF [Thermodesulfobacteriota bacterium]|nr:flagellar basal-body rod protein FlgF [Thermodesulfobacteriota bacterium]
MDQGIYTAAAGAMAMEMSLSIISNNLANNNTTGFKKDTISFEQFTKALDTSKLDKGQYQRPPIDVLAKMDHIDISQGSLHKTGNPLDLAIAGDGFFAVMTADGPRYTRAGKFLISSDGLLVNAHGQSVQGEGGDIMLGPGNVVVNTDGNITLNGEAIDKIQIVTIPEDALTRQGYSLFNVKEGTYPEPMDSPNVVQGALETSNVEPIKELVGLINTQRAYEAFQKTIKAFQDSYSSSIRNIGTLA